MPHLPKSSGDTLAYGQVIAKDAKRLAAAVDYWRGALKALSEMVMETGKFSSEAMTFGKALPDRSLAALIKEFSGYFDAKDEAEMVTMSGCLMSSDDLARHVYGTAAKSLEDELKYLGDLSGAANALDKKDWDRVALALQLAREVYDLVRRFKISTENAKAMGTARSELLAIYFQEGALGIAPPRTSWAHAPLVATTKGGCRTHGIKLWDAETDGGTTSRTSFVVSHIAGGGSTPSLKNPVSASFGTLIRHLVILAGADTIIDPRLLSVDELLAWYTKVLASKAGSYPALDDLKAKVLSKLNDKPSTPGSLFERQRSITSQRAIFDGMAIGLIMLQLEAASTAAPLGEEKLIIQTMTGEMQALLNAHSAAVESSGHIVLAPADDFQDARTSLSVQARWYASRRRIDTVLAIRDRARWAGPTHWAPILAYLRYNIGEFSFLRMLCRFAAKLKDYRSVAFQKKHRIDAGFASTAASRGWTTVDAKQAEKLYENVRNLASKTNIGGSPGWRHVGLLDALAARGPVCCKPVATPPWMALAADTAQDILKLYNDYNLFDLLAYFMSAHRIRTLVDPDVNLVALMPANSPQPTRNAFSFERLRRAYAKALNDAKMNEIPS